MKKSFYIFILFAGFITAAPKLTRNYAHRYFTTRDGLVQMQVMCAFQDKDGYMWFGTKGGVSRWDGSSFKTYTPENGLPLGETVNISEWGSRKLIFTHRQMAILYQNDSIFSQNLPEKMLYNAFVNRTLVVDNENIIIFGIIEEYANDITNPIYHFIYNIKTKKFTRITYFNQMVLSVIDKHIVSSKGLFYWTGEKFELKLKFPHEVQAAIFDKKLEKCALQQLNKDYFELYDIKKGQLISFAKFMNEDLSLSTWLPDKSFLNLARNCHNFYPEHKASLQPNFTSPNFSFVDKENNLWIGTENGLYNFFNLKIEEFNFSLGTPDNIWSIVEDKTGTIWLGSYGNGLYTYDKKGNVNKIDFSDKLCKRYKIANKYIYMGSTTDDDKTVYISTSYGIAKFVDGKIQKISGTQGCLYAFYDIETKELMYSGSDTTSQRRGMFIGMDNNKKFYPFDKGFAICIIRDGNGKIRVGGFRGTGVLEINKIKSDTLKCAYVGVVSMAIDSSKRLWKATEKGIFVEHTDGSEYRVAKNQLIGGYTSLGVYKNKYLIAGGTKSFAIVDIKNITDYEKAVVINIGYEGGFTGLESGQNGLWISDDGNVWLTTALNILRFNPDEIVQDHLHFLPTLRLAEISYSSDNNNWKNHFFEDGAVSISSKNKFFRIHYIANSISTSKSLRFSYRLKGLDNKWSEPTYDKLVNYTNLSYGKYIFEVKCSLDGEKWSEISSSPEIEIVPPLLLRKIFLLAYVILFVLVIVLLTRVIIFRKQQKKIENLNRQKLENELQLNTLRSKIIPHFTKNVLSAIGHFAMTDKLKASHYISVFSKFTGLTLANADKNYITLSEELEYIGKYLELEKMRFGDNFEYEISIDNNVSLSLFWLMPIKK